MSQRRYFEAEMVVRKDLKPSFTFPMFSLQVGYSFIHVTYDRLHVDLYWMIETYTNNRPQ